MTARLPIIGEDVYIGTSLYIDHGEDDFEGGLCEIIGIQDGISAGEKAIYVRVKEDPFSWHNWSFLMESQDKWRERYGNQRGHPDPDYGG